MSAQTAMNELHAAWNKATGQEVKYRVTERFWYELWSNEYTADDLRLVIDSLQRFNRDSTGAKFSLSVYNVLSDLAKFDGILNEARAKLRNRRPAPTAKQQVEALRTRPVDPEQSSTLKLGDTPDFKTLLKKIADTPPAEKP